MSVDQLSPGPEADRLAEAAGALASGSWSHAESLFTDLLARSPDSPELLAGLGDAAWWQGDADRAVEFMERAFVEFRRAERADEATMSAVWLSIIYLKSLGNAAAAAGWVGRAASAAAEGATALTAAWVNLARSVVCPDPAEALTEAECALQAGRTHRDRDLELSALAQLGCVLVTDGRTEEGMPMIDEAMAAALAGEGQSLETVVAATCTMLLACDAALDLERIREWCRAAEGFIETYGCPFLYADCRSRYGRVLLDCGHFADAERELTAALATAPPGTRYHTESLASLAELRVRQGRLREVEALLEPIADHPAAVPVVAGACLRDGQPERAVSLLRRVLDRAELDPANRFASLGLLVEALARIGDRELACGVLEQMDQQAGAAPRPRFAGQRAMAAASCAERDAEVVQELERAVGCFAEAGLGYETALARLRLAETLAGQQDPAAAGEAQGAASALANLGAADADRAAALARSLGAPARTGVRRPGQLSDREREVLALVAEGLTNPEIGRRLHISPKTASHHVSSLLSKLGVRSRAEAAAVAARGMQGDL